MCGIVGLFGKVTRPKIKAFEEAFQIDVMRGEDSCGIAIVGDKGVDVVKDIVWPDELLLTDEYEDAVVKQEATSIKLLLGHNRAATRGTVTQKNAHPFTVGKITLVHNGTAWCYRLPGLSKDTDSETIAKGIDDIGVEKAWKLIDGAATLVWWDSEQNKLFMLSNGKRPLWFMEYGGNSESIMFASEPWMMLTACLRWQVPINWTKLWSVDVNKLYEFDFSDGRVTYTSKELAPFKYEYEATNSNSSNYGMYGCDGWGYEGIDDMGIDPNEDNKHSWNCNCAECCCNRREEINKAADKIYQDSCEKGVSDNTEDKPFPGESMWGTFKKDLLGRVRDIKADIKTKRISEQSFTDNYHQCSCCGHILKGQYKEAMIINYISNDALCESCTTMALWGSYYPTSERGIAIMQTRFKRHANDNPEVTVH